MAKLYFRYSAMNAGKSTALLQVAHNYEEEGKKVKVVKPAIDTKGNDKVVSRLGISREVDYAVKKDENIKNLNFEDVSCILVDECQFLTREQVNQLFEIAVIWDIPVICYGLRTDFLAKGFEGSTRLLEIAHQLEEMKTICSGEKGCNKKAILNIRYINGKAVFDGEQVVIDDDSKVEYKSVCGSCYIKEKGKI